MRLKGIENIIWDWNGTLLNDVTICVDAINVVLAKRKLPTLNVERYRSVFTFPVKDYYKRLGFDFNNESFEIPAMEFIHEFERRLPGAVLNRHAIKILNFFTQKGFTQFVLSAMEQDALLKSVSMTGIQKYFREIKGIQDHYANGKIHIAQELMEKNKMNASKTLLIGDTLHDMEVAEYLGIHFILISAGHQSKEKLEEAGIKSFPYLNEIMLFF